MDFARIKAIPIIEMCSRYGVALRYRGEWGHAVCPLPSHKPGDRDKTFAVNVKENYWICHSKTCNAKAGKRGGDVISFVAAKLQIKDTEAAAKLAELYHLNGNKKAPHSEEPGQKAPAKHYQQSNKPAIAGKGYIHELGMWFDELVERGELEEEEAYWKRIKKGFLEKVIQSFRNGKRQQEGLLPE